MSYDPKVFELGWDFILAGKHKRAIRIAISSQPNREKSNQSTILTHELELTRAGERYRELNMEKVPLEDQYEMCGLFKQSTFGDIDIKCKSFKESQNQYRDNSEY